jgi:hypothetical protein
MLIQRDAWEVRGDICKSVIRSGRLSAKLSIPRVPLDQHHVTQIRNLHGCTEGLVCTRNVPYLYRTSIIIVLVYKFKDKKDLISCYIFLFFLSKLNKIYLLFLEITFNHVYTKKIMRGWNLNNTFLHPSLIKPFLD